MRGWSRFGSREIARKIKRVAEEKIGAITDRIEKDEQPAAATGGPGCCGSSETNRPVVTAGARADCGCH